MQHTAILRGVCVIMERSDGKVLLHLRCSAAWVYPDCWTFFGGGVEKGESSFAALRREWLEELGYPLTHHRLFGVAWHRKAGRRILDHTYLATWRQRPTRLREGRAMNWFDLEEALALPTLPPHERHDLTRLGQLRREHGRVALAA